MLVDIVPVGEVPADVKREASGALRAVYDCEVNVREQQAIPSGAYNAGREQYRAEDFIQQARRVGRGEKNIAITPKDLYYHRRNYVFGLAYLDGEGSVISTYRLDDEEGVGTATDGGFSSRDAGEQFGARVRKEVVHEIGHTMGLEHCSNNRCVMSFSPTVREVDVKEENLCGSCQRDVM
jgi:archaemetzincin